MRRLVPARRSEGSLRCVKPSSRGMDRPVFVCDPEVERTTIVQAQDQFLALPVQFRDVQVIESCDATFNLDVRRNRLAFLVGEVMIDGQMVVNSPEVTITIQEDALSYWLFHQALHRSDFTPSLILLRDQRMRRLVDA
jgi:hypothetical protein